MTLRLPCCPALQERSHQRQQAAEAAHEEAISGAAAAQALACTAAAEREAAEALRRQLDLRCVCEGCLGASLYVRLHRT